MIEILKQADSLLLTYVPDRFNSVQWLDEKLRKDNKVTLRRTFTFKTGNLLSQPQRADDEDDAERIFKMGAAEDAYHRIDKAILGLKHDLLLDNAMRLDPQIFVANRDISIFRKFDELLDEQIIVGGENENAIPLIDFELLIQAFPTYTELTHYARSRISRVLKDSGNRVSATHTRVNPGKPCC